ncbi:hypothetical protein F0562_030803 [Nyssa sinensis]|uniref:Uncharacterized protein n=1 Tax=Nyssa sinensis TaxID=561372 RepID=A0A5J5B0T7_9ASTE|nr:hypothetical protein F0562_030803 [Nyssa sinensis]
MSMPLLIHYPFRHPVLLTLIKKWTGSQSSQGVQASRTTEQGRTWQQETWLDPLVYHPSHASSHAVTLPHTNATSKIQNQHVVQSAGVACPLALASCSDGDYPSLPTAGNSGNQKAAQPAAIPCNTNAVVQTRVGVHYSNPYTSHENRGVQETVQTKADSIAIASIGVDRHGDSFTGAQTVAAHIGNEAPLLTHSRAESMVQSITFTGIQQNPSTAVIEADVSAGIRSHRGLQPNKADISVGIHSCANNGAPSLIHPASLIGPRGSTSLVTYNSHSGIQQGLDPTAITKAQLIVSSSNDEVTK